MFDETSSKLMSTQKLLKQKYSELEKITGDLTNVETKLKAGEMTKKNAFKRTTANALRAASKLSNLRDKLVDNIKLTNRIFEPYRLSNDLYQSFKNITR